MPKKQDSEYIEIKLPQYVLPLVVVVIGVLILAVIFLRDGSKVEDAEVNDNEPAVEFEDSDTVEAKVKIDFEEGAYIGDLETAKYAIVEFSDYQCGFCARHASGTLPQIREKILGDGEVVYFFREMAMYPPKSMTLSVLGQCIFENEGLDNYLAYRGKAYDLSFEDDASLLAQIEVGAEASTCFANREYESRIENNSVLSQQAKVQGVPGFVVGKLSEDGTVEGYLIAGAYPFETFEEVLATLKK